MGRRFMRGRSCLRRDAVVGPDERRGLRHGGHQSRHADAEGRTQDLPLETFGSEAFWGDTLELHKAIAGAKNGGVGPGVSPKAALAVGLKVDADALSEA